MRRRNRILAVAAAVVALAALIVAARHAILKFVLEQGLGIATGYEMRFGDAQLGWTHAVLRDVRIRSRGDPLLDAQRIDVDYALRDFFPGGRHRFGFVSAAVQQPTLTLVRHRDGSYNVAAGGIAAQPSTATQHATEPLQFSARVRGGTIRLVDRAPLQPDLAEQSIVDVTIDASVASEARTTARIAGVWLGRRTAGAPVERWPVTLRTTIDDEHGLAVHRLRAAALPIRGALGFAVHAPIARFDDGVLRDVDVLAYAVDVVPDAPIAYRLGGGGRLIGGRLAVGPLARPLRDLHGPVALYDNGVTMPDMQGSLAGIPLRAHGGVFDFRSPRFQFGINADGDLHALRTAFAVTRDQPLSGAAHLETAIVGALDAPVIRTVFDGPRLLYDGIPLTAVHAIVDYANAEVSVTGAHGRYGAIAAALDGDVVLASGVTPMRFFLRATGPASELPYVQNVAAGATVDARTLIAGSPEGGFHVGGSLAVSGAGSSGEGFLAVDERGQGEFGPFAFARADGSSLVGTLRLERPISSSAGWLTARHYRLDLPAHLALLPGLGVTPFPPLAGTLDATLIGGGTPGAFGVAGRVHATGFRFDRFRIGTADALLGGSLGDLRLQGIAVDGPLGHFRGAGAFAGDTLGLTGSYTGSFEALEPFTGPIGTSGSVRAPVAVLIDPRRIVVQSTGATVGHGSVRGIAIERAAGTLSIAGPAVRVVAADADVAGSRVVAAAQSANAVAVSVVDLPARALRGAGFPLDRGRLSLFGVGDLHGPRFRGTADLDDGSAYGFPVRGWADLQFAGTTLTVSDGVGAFGTTYGRIAGEVDDVTGPAPQYRLTGTVPLGDAAALVRDLQLPVQRVAGTYTADLLIAGTGGAPRIAGQVTALEGNYHGVEFHDGAATLDIAPPAIRVDDGSLTIGSTRTRLSAALSPGRLAFHAASAAADLSDFNGYFDQIDALAGRGAFDLALSSDGRSLTSSGTLDLRNARFLRYPFGNVTGHWASAGGTISGAGTIAGPAGALEATGRIVAAPGSAVDALRRARYDLDLKATGLDLGQWLPAAGYGFPLLGSVDAAGHLAGSFPKLTLTGDVALRDGIIGSYAIASASARAEVSPERVVLASANADLGFASFTGSGSLALSGAGPFSLHVHAATPDIVGATHRLLPGRNLDVAGALDLDVVFDGTRSRPHVTAGLDLENGRLGALAIPRVIAAAESDFSTIQLNSADVELPRGRAILAGSLPITLQPPGIGPASAPLSLTLDGQGVDLAAFAPFVPGGDVKLGGTLDGKLALEGTVGSPRVLGSGTLRDGFYASRFETAPIHNVDGAVNFNGTSVALQRLHADVGSGTLDASGELNLPIPDAPSTGFSIAVAAKGAQLTFPAYGGGRFDGNARIVGGSRRPTLSGNVTVSDARIPFAAIVHAAGGGAEQAEGTGPVFDLGFDLKGTIGKNVRIRSPILDIGATGQLALTGSLRAPRLAGTLAATQGGVFSTYQRTFRIEQATVSFDPAQGIVPVIDLRATAHVTNPDPDPERNAIGSANIIVSVTGPADAYTTTFSSDPPYPQAQIIGLLIDAPLLGAVNFNARQSVGILPGAPGESNVLLPPGVTPYQSGSYSFQQEAFSLINAQLTQRLIAPLEGLFGGVLGLDDLGLTVDIGGRLGYTARRVISRHINLALNFGQILSYPVRTQFGFDLRPDATTSASFTYFTQAAAPALFGDPNSSYQYTSVLSGVQPLSNRQGFRFNLTRRYP